MNKRNVSFLGRSRGKLFDQMVASTEQLNAVGVAIDGAPVAEMDERGVVARLRGEVGTTVTLRVRRDGAEREVRVERAPYRRRERD